MTDVEKVAQQLATLTKDSHDQRQVWLQQRFDRIDEDNTAMLSELRAHIADDKTIALTVQQHSTYWGIVKFAGITIIGVAGSLFAAVGGFFGISHKN